NGGVPSARRDARPAPWPRRPGRAARPPRSSSAHPLTFRLVVAVPIAVRVPVLAEERVQLVLEAAGVDGAVDAALLGCVGLPPPATGAVLLSRLDGPGARRTSDRRVALVLELVVGHVVRPDVVPHLS